MAELIVQNRKKQSSESDAVSQRKSATVLQDNRDQVSQTRALPDNRTAQLEQNSSPKPNNTGLPNQLKAGIESLSGMSMDHVKVHYNSSQPAQLNAHAYAQGSEIHVAPGQEKHLPHEAWHVVQQAQGRVKPTVQMKQGVPVNDDHRLEDEADQMGRKALVSATEHSEAQAPKVERRAVRGVLQRFPRPRQIVAADGVITAHDLIGILHAATQAELAGPALASRGASDWFSNFAQAGDPAGAYPVLPPASPGLAYHHASVTHTFTIGGENLVRIGANNYVYPEGAPAGNAHVSYPELHSALTDHAVAPANEVARAQRMRAMLAGGVTFAAPVAMAPGAAGAPTQATHEAVATAALFGAETARAPRTYLSHMMALDRLESQQPYGAGKSLTLRKLLNPPKVVVHGGLGPGGVQSNNQFGVAKVASFGVRAPGVAVPIGMVGAGFAPHGGKAAMAGAGTRAMGKAPLPGPGVALNLVQAKEVNNLYNWLALQLGPGAFAAMPRAAALARIQQLVQERARSYYLMNQAQNTARQQTAAATRIQTGMRGMLARRVAGRLRTERQNNAATRIQAGVRGMMARREVGRLRTERQNNAATRIQAGVRGMMARREVGRLRTERQNNAATRIQAGVRGMMARKQVGKERELLQIQIGWAETLGRMYGWSGRTISEFARSAEAREYAERHLNSRDQPAPSYIN